MSPETSGVHRATAKPADALVRSQLEKILDSDLLRRSERLSRFLRFIVQQSLDGSGDELKEQVLARELYGRGTEFDTAADPIVRVDARRLRDKLREYYAGALSDPVIISLPKGSYRPLFELNPAVPAPLVPAHPAIGFPADSRPEGRMASAWHWIVAAATTVMLLAVGMTWLATREPSVREFRVVPLASFPGIEGPPSLSPDGNFVAFSWSDSEGAAARDIWIKAVDSEDRRRLTDTPLDDELNPAWSPNGREIAFVRRRQGLPGGVFTASVLSSAERRVSDSGTHVGWAADSRSVLIRDREAENRPYGIFQVLLSTLERRRLTQAPAGIGDWKFDVSPDGRTLAWIRYERPGISDLFVIPTEGGQARRLTNHNTSLGGLAWTPDGREIVYSAKHNGAQRLFRLGSNGDEPGRGSPIEGIPTEADHPSLSRRNSGTGVRLAFQIRSMDIDLQMVDVTTPSPDGLIPARPFLPSTRIEGSARFSPDGNQVAFISYRSGAGEIWVAGLDGSSLRRLTDLGGSETVIGSWSPDASRVVFTSVIDGNSDIYSVGAEGGRPVRLTVEPSMDILPSYSADGRWIYFSKNVTSVEFRVWRIPAEGGRAVQITRQGGFQPQESPDGRYLFYLDGPRAVSGIEAPSKLMKMPLGGGPEETVLENVPAFAWSVTQKGVFFVRREREYDAVDLYRFRDQTRVRIGLLNFRLPLVISHTAFSPDGTRALATNMVRDDADLMFIDDFR
jgi:Tol biopolymer transport system component